MKRIISRSLGGIVLSMLVLFGWLSWRSYGRQAIPTSMIVPAAPMQVAANAPVEKVNQQESPLPTVTPTPIPTLAVWVTPELLPIAWSAPPPCQNQPRAVVEWQNKVRDEKETAKEKTRLSFKRVQRLSPSLQAQGDADQLMASFLEESGTDEKKALSQDKLGLWLNIVSGYINRETEIAIADLPEIKTVKELTQLLEPTTDDPATLKKLRKAIDDVLKGKAITNPVCANLLVRQGNADLQSIVWKSAGISKNQISLVSKVDLPGLMLGLFKISPDYRRFAIESRGYERGGPIFLYDLETQALTNLNLALQLTLTAEQDISLVTMDQNERWQVIGWHPDGQHLLLVAEAQSSVFWVDLQKQTYERIYLDTNSETLYASRVTIDLLPDGTGFVYVSTDRSGVLKNKLQLFDLNTKTIQTLAEVSNEVGRLYTPRVSPTGEKVVFLVETGTSAGDINYILRVFDFKTQRSTDVVSGYFGRAEPVWSPDGQSIAFPWSAPEMAGFYALFPEANDWIGNIWVASRETGQIQQVTDIKGAARNPTWSLDSSTITFFTHDGQFGATLLSDRKTIWQVAGDGSTKPSYGSLVYLP